MPLWWESGYEPFWYQPDDGGICEACAEPLELGDYSRHCGTCVADIEASIDSFEVAVETKGNAE